MDWRYSEGLVKMLFDLCWVVQSCSRAPRRVARAEINVLEAEDQMERSQVAAKRRSQAVPIPRGNADKYFSYSEAWVRIKKARGSGFYLEAVTLQESIIADRLVSFLVCVGEIQADFQIEKCSFGQLIQLWRKRVPQPIPVPYFPDLGLCSRRMAKASQSSGSRHGEVHARRSTR
jgi:hypothetical protein